MKLPLQPYKGARDFYPEDKRKQNYIFKIWKQSVERFGYEQYDAPLLELTDLFRAKSGEEIVNKQTYSFEDRGGRDVSIRPEMTPSVSRMMAARRQEVTLPARWYSIPNLWRYERPQHGRLREHWQLNVDIFGIDTIDAELELILVVDEIMKSFGATSKMYTINVNSRKLNSLIMAEYLELDPEEAGLMIRLLDRKDKTEKEVFLGEAEQIFDEKSRESGMAKLTELLDAKSLADLPSTIRDSAPMKQIQILFTHLKENGVSNANFDVALMRGFDYYTDIVFEVMDNHPDNNRSLFGGGRYDGLVGMFGVEPVSTAGFGMGDVTIADFLEAHELVPDLQSETDIYLVTIGDVVRQAQGIAGILREEGVNIAVDITDRKVEKQIKVATSKKIPYALFVGEDDLNEERFNLKNLDTQEEEKLSLERIISKVKDYRSRDN
jgi:histidyl-tRNA synthetase